MPSSPTAIRGAALVILAVAACRPAETPDIPSGPSPHRVPLEDCDAGPILRELAGQFVAAPPRTAFSRMIVPGKDGWPALAEFLEANRTLVPQLIEASRCARCGADAPRDLATLRGFANLLAIAAREAQADGRDYVEMLDAAFRIGVLVSARDTPSDLDLHLGFMLIGLAARELHGRLVLEFARAEPRPPPRIDEMMLLGYEPPPLAENTASDSSAPFARAARSDLLDALNAARSMLAILRDA
jgi:hypothetical protein